MLVVSIFVSALGSHYSVTGAWAVDRVKTLNDAETGATPLSQHTERASRKGHFERKIFFRIVSVTRSGRDAPETLFKTLLSSSTPASVAV